jgi:hypothetical protein
VGTSKILALYKGSTISLQAAVHLGHRPRALMTKKKSREIIKEIFLKTGVKYSS